MQVNSRLYDCATISFISHGIVIISHFNIELGLLLLYLTTIILYLDLIENIDSLFNLSSGSFNMSIFLFPTYIVSHSVG